MDSQILISDPVDFEIKKRRMQEEGKDKIHILADFDKTLTYAYTDGEKVPSLIAILRAEHILGEEYSAAAHELYSYYSPFESNMSISLKERKDMMKEWWEKHYELLIHSGIKKADIERVAISEKLRLRDGVLASLQICAEAEIPVVIMSASGLGGEAISLYLEKRNSFSENVHVISNFFLWDDQGNAVDFHRPVIHSLNKDEAVLQSFPEIYTDVKDRKNVILLGDSLGDLGMIEGFDYEEIITIGILGDGSEENLSFYQGRFDVVITNDGSLQFLQNILEEIIYTA